jgi:hypothetical protein
VIGPVLSVRQPWASAVIWRGKDVENRSRPTRHRGAVFIHASLREDPSWPSSPMAAVVGALDADLLAVRGAIIGTAELVDCVRGADSPWALPGYWHWVLEDPLPVEPVRVRGALGLWYIGRGL